MENKINPKKNRNVSPSPSSASKVSTVSKLSAVVKLTGFKKKPAKGVDDSLQSSSSKNDKKKQKKDSKQDKENKQQKDSKQKQQDKQLKKKGKSSITSTTTSSLKQPDAAPTQPTSDVTEISQNVSSESPTITDDTPQRRQSAVSNVDDQTYQTSTATTTNTGTATNNTTTPMVKSATLERDSNLSPQQSRTDGASHDNNKKRYFTLTRGKRAPEKVKFANQTVNKFKLFGKKPYSKAVAVESTTLDMRPTARSRTQTNVNAGKEEESDRTQSLSPDTTEYNDTKMQQLNNAVDTNLWSTESTNEKVLHHLQSTEVYDSSEDNEILAEQNGTPVAPFARQESTSLNESGGEPVTSTTTIYRRTSENGHLHIRKKSPSEIRQEILFRSAPRKVSEIVSPTFQANKSNHLPRQISLQAKNSVEDNKKELLCKILVIGELGTGKTSIIKRYVHQFFSQHYRATIGVDFALKVLAWDADTTIRLQLWDIAGQERFGNMTRVYYKEAHGAFIVFDVTRLATFEAVVKWKQDLDSKVQLTDGSPVPCVLLANKCDQPKEGIVNNHSKMDEYCKENKFIGWYETSAKDNINIDQAANFLVTKILQNEQRKEDAETNNSAGVVSLENPYEEKKKSCAC